MATTNVRTFANPDYISVGAGGADSGFGTYLAVCKRNSTGYEAYLSARQASGADLTSMLVEDNASGNQPYYYNGAASSGGGNTMTFVNADGWCVLAYTKATGTAAPRAHKCLLSGPTWTHETAGTALANGAAGTGWRLGRWFDGGAGGDTFDGDIYCIARWDANALSDGNLATIDGVTAIIALTPTNLWLLDQASTATAVTDYMATGSNETALVGTSVTSGVDIPNFDETVPSTTLTWRNVQANQSPVVAEQARIGISGGFGGRG